MEFLDELKINYSSNKNFKPEKNHICDELLLKELKEALLENSKKGFNYHIVRIPNEIDSLSSDWMVNGSVYSYIENNHDQ